MLTQHYITRRQSDEWLMDIGIKHQVPSIPIADADGRGDPEISLIGEWTEEKGGQKDPSLNGIPGGFLPEKILEFLYCISWQFLLTKVMFSEWRFVPTLITQLPRRKANSELSTRVIPLYCD